MRIPDILRHNIVAVHGQRGSDWLLSLDDTLSAVAARFNVEVIEPLPNLTYHLVVTVRNSSGEEQVVKVGVPGAGINREAAALQAFGASAVRVFDCDTRLGAILMERVQPGNSLESEWSVERDEQHTRAIAQLMPQLWCAPPAEGVFPTLMEWVGGFSRLREQFGGGTGPLAEELVAEAEEILGRLAVAPPSLLLHGDLHHGNVLRRGSGFCAIDPHGVIGNPLFEAAAMMHNPHRLAGVELRPILRRRVEVLSEVLSWDADSIRLTGLAGAMLSAVWTWEDDGVVAHDALAVAQALRSL